MREWFKKAFRNVKVVTALALVVIIGLNAFPHFFRDSVTTTVTKTETKVDKETGESKYLVFTTTGTYENTDSWLELKVNSSDVYGKLTPGKEYTFTVYGFRIPLLSMYKNIASVDKSPE